MFENLKADIGRYRRYGVHLNIVRLYFDNQGLWAVVCYRFGRWLMEHPPPFGVRHLLKILFQLHWKVVQMTTGIYISPAVKVGPGFYIGHFGQIFMGGDTVVGRDFNISQGVTLGYAFRDGRWGVPTAGDRVYIAAGAKVIGPVHLADGTVVGANAVVTKSTEENAVVAGVPARVLSHEGSSAYIPNQDQT